MGRVAHFARRAAAVPWVDVRPLAGLTVSNQEGNAVDYETPEIESQVDVKGIMGLGGWGGGLAKPYSG
jgi:hypothetical protein